jgi:Glycosyltransferase 61
MQLRNFIRRHKWRLRPFKRLVLPMRTAQRFLVRFLRRPLTIESYAADYRGPSFCDLTEIYPAATIPQPPFPSQESSIELVSQPARVYHLRNIEFWAQYGGSVVTADHKLLADLSPEVWGTENHLIFSQLLLPKCQKLEGRTAIAVTPEAPGNYYHWLIDLLPRVALLHSIEFDFDRCLINGLHTDYEQRSLQALGISPGKVVYVDRRNRFQIANAFIASMDHSARAIAPWKIDCLRTLRDSIPVPASPGRGKIYVSRRRAAVRQIINESEFEEMLQRANFTVVELETKPWNEQVALFGAADVVLAPHGAALANCAFCRPGAIVAEIGTRIGYRPFYRQLAAAARLQYHFIEARPKNSDANAFRAVENENMVLDIATLRDFVNRL